MQDTGRIIGNKPARQMALVSSQLLKQMFFQAGYSILLSPEIPKIKESPRRLKTQHIHPAQTLDLNLPLSTEGTVPGKVEVYMETSELSV